MDSVRDYHVKRLGALKVIRRPWDDLWKEINKYVVSGYYVSEDEGQKQDNALKNVLKGLDVVDNKAMQAHRIFRSGMQSGMTSKSRPWYRLTIRDSDLSEQENVKRFLDETTYRMRDVMARSNIYDGFHTQHGALGAIGTSVGYLVPDPTYIVRMRTLIAGSYWIATNHLGLVDTVYHVMRMTAYQIKGMFQQKTDKIPLAVEQAYDRGDYDREFTVYHAMEPRKDRDSDSKLPKHMPFLSNYWMDENEDDDLLRESGSTINRVIGVRWDVVGNDPYGYSLGLYALPEVKQLQHMQTNKLALIEKAHNPSLVAPSSAKNVEKSLLPGAVTYSDSLHQSEIKPLVNVTSYNLTPLLQDIEVVKNSIQDTFYVPLFMAISNMQGVQPRNEFELAQRQEERLLQLGPALDRLQDEALRPIIDIVFHYMREAYLLPEIPKEMQEDDSDDIDVEYTSIMAQAQKAIGVHAIERTLSFAGSVSAVDSSVMDNIDTDDAVQTFAKNVGAPNSLVVPRDEVLKIRQQRQQAEAAQQQLEQAQQVADTVNVGAQAANTLADVDNSGQDVINRMLNNGIGVV